MTVASDGKAHPYSQLFQPATMAPTMAEIESDMSALSVGGDGDDDDHGAHGDYAPPHAAGAMSPAPYPESDYGNEAPVSPIKPTGGAITMVDSPPKSPPKSPAFTAHERYYSPELELPQDAATEGIDPNIDAFHPGYADVGSGFGDDENPMGQSYSSQRIEPFPSDIPSGKRTRDRDVSTPTVQIHPFNPHEAYRDSPQPASVYSDSSSSQPGGFQAFPTEPMAPTDNYGNPAPSSNKRQSHPYTLPAHLQPQVPPAMGAPAPGAAPGAPGAPQPPQQPFNYHSQEMSPERGAAPALSPRFATRILGESPGSNSLSASSSVTNLNLNHGPGPQELMSRSETSLLVPGATNPAISPAKYGHTRSMSSSSSFFYDRSDTASMVDFSQNIIQQYLGSNSSHLVPRMKTIELYRTNAKKSKDPTVIFQFAQYMLQTALMMDDEPPAGATKSSTAPSTKARSPVSPSRRGGTGTNGAPSSPSEVDERKLRRSLIKEAVHYLKKLSDKGYTEAQYLLGDAYSSGALGKVENREAFVLFQQAAKHGHVESAYRTSICFEEGLGTGRDARKAVDYLKIAASRNHPAAMYKLGMYMFFGRMGISRNMNNEKMGIKWLTRASNVANELTAAAPYELGKLHFHGYKDIVIPDQNYALELYAQAAALGHVEAAALLGQFYEVGEVVPQDGTLSIHYYTQAALGGDPESMLAMCAWYLVGCEPHLPKDENEAFEWARRAAQCGLPKAQFAVANFYEKGIGCIKNVQDAQKWYVKAAANGDEKSLARITDRQQAAKIQQEMKKKPKKQNNLGPKGIDDKECVIM
ncbi:hypothetical protein DIURU_001479 [Diutina rugosa]|uniref:Activator of chitin synthase n=1 Tax=Diutina rugosa TaxID=5481 RepID=A0A642UUC9_DIURU|nr:uncharacterized protein DIURU_001479 [Diutina rugosa]KAA8905406.1 hypothetical protein DIURU_001479 [Diutina rugosa]